MHQLTLPASCGLPCQCGCGALAGVARMNDKSKGWVKGQPLKFLKGHGAAIASAIRTSRSIGNRSIISHGYIVIKTAANRRRYEHIIIAEHAIGRPLRNFGRGNPNTEIVHHINGDKADNRPENLLVCTHEYHVSLHHRLEQSAAWPEFARVVRRGFGGQQ